MVSDKQVRKLWQLLTAGKRLAAAAARTDMDDKTARKFRRLQKLPSEVARGRRKGVRPPEFQGV
jgi:hypothetical protein